MSTCTTANESEIQRQIPFQFTAENYANQVLGQKLTQSFIGSNNTEAKIITDQAMLSQTTDKQTMNDEIMNISAPIKNSSPKLQAKKRADCKILYDDERSERDKTEINNDMVDENSKNLDFEHQQFEKCQVLSKISNTGNNEQGNSGGELVTATNQNTIRENEQNFTTKTIFIGLQFADGKLFDIIGGLSGVASDPEHHQLHLSTAVNQKPEDGEISGKIFESEEKFELTPSNTNFSEAIHSEELLATKNHTELHCSSPEVIDEMEKIKKDVAYLMDINLVQNVSKSKSANKFQDEERKSVENEEVEEQKCSKVGEENAVNAEIEDDNAKCLSKSLQMISSETKKEIFDANTLIDDDSKGNVVAVEDKRSDISSNITDCNCEIVANEGCDVGGAAVNNTTIVAKSSKSLQSVNGKMEKSSSKIKRVKEENESVNTTGENARDATLPKLSVKTSKQKTLPTKVTLTSNKNTIIPTTKNANKSNGTMIDKKLATKSATAISTTKTILIDKNINEVGLKQTKKITNITSNKGKLTSTRTSTVLKSKLLPNTTESQLNNSTEVNLKSKSKNIIKENQKTENDENVLIGREKKIGVIDVEPLVWTEILVPTYEQIWESYEIKEINFEFEKMKNGEETEAKNAELAWEIKKNSEFTKVKATNSTTALSEKDKIDESECFNSLKNEVISNFSNSLQIKEENEEVDVEEEIVVENGSERREIEISGSISIKSSETAEISLKVKSEIPSEQKTTVVGQDSGIPDISGYLGNDAVVAYEPHLAETQNKTEAVTNKETDKMIVTDDSNKTEGINDDEKEIISKGEMAALKCEQQMQPELEKTDDGRRNDDESLSKHHQQRGQFGRMYSDVPKGCTEHNATGKDISRKHQQGNRQQNCSQEVRGEISDNVELQGNNYQQQTTGNHHSLKQQQQHQPDNVNDRHNRNYSGQQGHRKRNKRNKKPRN